MPISVQNINSTLNSTHVSNHHSQSVDQNGAENAEQELWTTNSAPSKKNPQQLECIRDTESYAFLIGWSIVNYSIVLVFAILLLTWYDINQKSTQIRIRILEIIRQVNLQDQEGLDILESSLANVQDEINRRQEFVRTLHEYGIFLM